MPLQKTEAIVLKTQKLGETSKILTLYTRKYGKIKVVAKGARGLKSRFYGSIEPLNYIAIVFYYNEKREIQFLSQADIIASFIEIKDNLEKFSLASTVCEIILRSQYDEESNINLFKTIIKFLAELDKAEARLENYFLWFQLKFLEINGIKPKLNGCISCGENNIDNDKWYFSMNDGGYSCHRCNTKQSTGYSISQNTIEFMHSLEQCVVENIMEIENSKQVVEESSFLLNKYMRYHIEGLENLKSIKFLEQVQL